MCLYFLLCISLEACISNLWCQTANMVKLKINITLACLLEKGFFFIKKVISQNHYSFVQYSWLSFEATTNHCVTQTGYFFFLSTFQITCGFETPHLSSLTYAKQCRKRCAEYWVLSNVKNNILLDFIKKIWQCLMRLTEQLLSWWLSQDSGSPLLSAVWFDSAATVTAVCKPRDACGTEHDWILIDYLGKVRA